MINITSTQLDAWFALFIWPFLRILGLMLSEPLLGHRALPRRIKMGLALLLTITIAPMLPAPPPVSFTSAQGIVIAIQQLFIGFALGFSIRLVLSSIVIVFRVQPDSRHQQPAATLKKISLIAAMVGLYAVGLFSEKRAIDTIGVWNYASFGWLLQLIGALALCSFYGRHELSHATWRGVQKGLTLGFVTSLAGGLFIYALSIGTLSHTIIANSGKVALTTLFAAIFLHERNALQQRLLAFVLSMGGLWFLVQ